MHNPTDHIAFPPRLVLQVGLRCWLVRQRIAPDLEFARLVDVEHILKYVEIAECLIQNVESFQCHLVHMQAILKRDVINFRQGGQGVLEE